MLMSQTVNGSAMDGSRSVNPMSLYGDEIVFDVYREGTLVGFHTVKFSENEGYLNVRSVFQLDIKFLFITAYSYLYESDARWRDDQLQKLEARVDDNGDLSIVKAAQEGGGMRIESVNGQADSEVSLFPTNHWHAGVLNQTQVLNTLTGRINDVQIVDGDRETVDTEKGPIQATRFAYTGDLENEVWYDDRGRWVKMRFKGTDGSIIDYVCRRCQGAAS
ncbi:MAG: hypothetical protein CMN56_00725 [Sneathiella sp.]|nr:hypothetical protein [Sneathiella sp.]